jgi:hypothetical protein
MVCVPGRTRGLNHKWLWQSEMSRKYTSSVDRIHLCWWAVTWIRYYWDCWPCVSFQAALRQSWQNLCLNSQLPFWNFQVSSFMCHWTGRPYPQTLLVQMFRLGSCMESVDWFACLLSTTMGKVSAHIIAWLGHQCLVNNSRPQLLNRTRRGYAVASAAYTHRDSWQFVRA